MLARKARNALEGMLKEGMACFLEECLGRKECSAPLLLASVKLYMRHDVTKHQGSALALAVGDPALKGSWSILKNLMLQVCWVCL